MARIGEDPRAATEFREQIFVPPALGRATSKSLLGRCLDCNRLFLKSRSDQACCSPICSKRHDYTRRFFSAESLKSTGRGFQQNEGKANDFFTARNWLQNTRLTRGAGSSIARATDF